MKKIISSLLSIVLAAGMVLSAVNTNVSAATTYNLNSYSYANRSRETIAQQYFAAKNTAPANNAIYFVQPSRTAPYQAGSITQATHNSITAMLNYMRWLVGVNNNIPNSTHSDALQAGAFLRSWQFDHQISRSNMPSDMPDSIWNLGGNVDHNIIAMGYTPQGAIVGFINEGYRTSTGAFDTIGHRMMLIGYEVSGVNFGYSASVEMGDVTGWTNTTTLPFVSFPPAGYCPNEVITPNYSAWSVELNSDKLTYSSLSNVVVTVTNLSNNSSYTCTTANGKLTSSYGALAFAQPVATGSTYGNTAYRVSITGLKTPGGDSATAQFTTTFFNASEYVDSAVSSVALSCGATAVQVSTNMTADQLNMAASALGNTVKITAANGRVAEVPVSGKWQVNTSGKYFYNSVSTSSLPAHLVDSSNKLSQIRIPYTQTYIGGMLNSSTSINGGESFTFSFRHYWISTNGLKLYQITGSSGNYSATLRGTPSSSNFSYDSNEYTSNFTFSNLNSSYSGSYLVAYQGGGNDTLMICSPMSLTVIGGNSTPTGGSSSGSTPSTPYTPSTPAAGGNSSSGSGAGSSTASGVSGFIERLYNAALGRGSDPAGMQDWTNYIYRDGGTGAGMARGFLFSPEFLNKAVSDSEFVDVLYLTFFDRPADPDGKATWVNVLAGGASRRSVIEGFINSIEFANLCMRYGIPSGTAVSPTITVEPSDQVLAFATRLYTTCLGRNPDPDGLRTWSVAIANRRWSGSQAAHDFFFSPEFISYNVTNEEYVTRLYRTFMGREPDPDGYNMWVGLLNGGGWNREQVFNGFANSAEWNNICMRYGIIK